MKVFKDKMTYFDAIKVLSETLGRPMTEIKEVTDALTDLIAREVSKGNVVALRSFGQFYQIKTNNYYKPVKWTNGRTPAPPKKAMAFRAAIKLRDI